MITGEIVWPGMRRQVRDRLKRCPTCQAHSIIDNCTGWAEAYPIPDKTNRSMWTVFANQFLSRFGAPEILITDNGQEFCTTACTRYLKDLGIEHRRTTLVQPDSPTAR